MIWKCIQYIKKKSLVTAERFIRTLKNKIYKYMTSLSKSFYIDKLDDIVNKYINTYHSTITMKPVDIKSNIYILQKITLPIGLKKFFYN